MTLTDLGSAAENPRHTAPIPISASLRCAALAKDQLQPQVGSIIRQLRNRVVRVTAPQPLLLPVKAAQRTSTDNDLTVCLRPPAGTILSPAEFGKNIPILDIADARLISDVVNLCTKTVSSLQLKALSASLKFRQVPSKVPCLQLVSSVESSARQLQEVDFPSAIRFRSECANLLADATRPRPNMQADLRRTLQDISKMGSIIVTNADKGGKLVILDTLIYGEMCLLHLQDKVYEQVTSFGTEHSQVEVDDLFNEDFSEMDASDHLLKSQCQQLTSILNNLQKRSQLDLHE